jgi:hypothetical protein
VGKGALALSDEMTEAVKEQALALKQNAVINAASVAQRQNEAEERKRENSVGWDANFKIQALAQSVALNRNKPEAAAEAIIADADKFLAWLKGKPSE